MHCLQCLSIKEILTNHREVCLEKIRKQATKIPEKVSRNSFKQF